MPHVPFARTALAALLVACCADTALSQATRVAGIVRDDSNQPIKAATVTAENPEASRGTITASTDEKGRFQMIGLTPGSWTYKAQAPGFEVESGTFVVPARGASRLQLTVVLKTRPGAVIPQVLSGRDLQGELADADLAFNSGNWDEAIERYRALLAKAPSLHVIQLQIGNCYRNKKDYDKAIAAYGEVLDVDPGNDKATVGIGMANIEKGDLKAAEEALLPAAEGSTTATKDVFFALGEVASARGDADGSVRWYEKAAEADPAWARPIYKLARLALNKGDREGAVRRLEQVIAIDPISPEAVQARADLAQLRK